MPTYDYKCKECGCRFERRQKMSDQPIEVCPQCDGKVERLISGGAGVIFKGSGFYETDYHAVGPSCGRNTPCCGRDGVCDSKPCKP
jgi:putative FmdB family regulatory protein